MAVSDWSGAALPWFEDLATLKDRIGGLFRRVEPRRQIGLLLEGLIGGAERKNGWQLAEYAGDGAPGGCRRCLAGRNGIRRRRAISAGIM